MSIRGDGVPTASVTGGELSVFDRGRGSGLTSTMGP